MTQQTISRRTALAGAAALAVPYFVPAHVLGGQGQPAPSDRITLGVIGTGGRGRALINDALQHRDAVVLAVADVDRHHLDEGKRQTDQKAGNQDCQAYGDFRDLLARDDIDAVIVATPDHWHALNSVAAAQAGKDIYCEKPLANSIGEGRAIAQAVEANKRILQVGSHERSTAGCRQACELVRSGAIGKVRRVTVSLPTNDRHHNDARSFNEPLDPKPVPDHLDYDFWLGHTPKVAYQPRRVHFWWRFVLAYGGGEMTDRGAHVLDIAQLGLDKDTTGPVKIVAQGKRNTDSLYDVFWDYDFTLTYDDGTELVGTSQQGPRGLKFEGEDGWIFVHIHGGRLQANSADVLATPSDQLSHPLARSPGHMRNFLDCVKSRQQPLAPVEAGHRTGSLCHLANIAMLLERPLSWDPEKEQFANDDEANALVTPSMRDPWTLG